MTQKKPTQFRGSKRGQSQISQNYSSPRGAASPSPPLTRVTTLAKDPWAVFLRKLCTCGFIYAGQIAQKCIVKWV